MKKLINKPEDVVTEELQGIAAAHADLVRVQYGPNSGYAINPARDFGPRLFAWLAGWDGVALPGNYNNVNWYWWLPIVAPIVGAVIGAVVYDVFIHQGLRARGAVPAPDVEEVGRVVEEKPVAPPPEETP